MKYRLLIVICMTLFCSSVAIGDTGLEEKAQNLVSEYLTALKQGDTKLLLEIIGGNFLESRRTLLQNPDYSTYLIEFYTNASLSVTGSRQITDKSIEVNAVIENSVNEQFSLIFLVEIVKDKGNNLLIVAEQDAD